MPHFYARFYIGYFIAQAPILPLKRFEILGAIWHSHGRL